MPRLLLCGPYFTILQKRSWEVLVWRTSSMMLCLSNEKSKRKAKDENREPARERNCKVKKIVLLYQLRAEKFKVTISFTVLLRRLQKRGIVWHKWRSILEVYSVCQVSLLLLFLPSPDKGGELYFLSHSAMYFIHNSLMISIFNLRWRNLYSERSPPVSGAFEEYILWC